MFLAKTPQLLQWMMPGYTWKVPVERKSLFLSFDDGPIPEVTPWVLEILNMFDATATFFCVGDNVRKHPAIFRSLLAAGHAVGNHTFNHLNGWKTELPEYLVNVERCFSVMSETGFKPAPGGGKMLFRPPYGRLKGAQRRALSGQFELVMWDVLSGDFSSEFSPDTVLRHIIRHAVPGSIVVMHDSLKAERNLRYVLPRVLEHFSEQGYRFEKFPGA